MVFIGSHPLLIGGRSVDGRERNIDEPQVDGELTAMVNEMAQVLTSDHAEAS
jgi:hypothetical protein